MGWCRGARRGGEASRDGRAPATVVGVDRGQCPPVAESLAERLRRARRGLPSRAREVEAEAGLLELTPQLRRATGTVGRDVEMRVLQRGTQLFDSRLPSAHLPLRFRDRALCAAPLRLATFAGLCPTALPALLRL